MKRALRRTLLTSVFALSFGLSALAHGITHREAPADLVVLDAEVQTVSDRQPQAQAFAVRDGRFVAVGKSSDMASWIGPKTTVWRLAGKTITPGFNDAHLHPAPVYTEDAPQYVVPLDPEHVKTIDDLVAALRRKAARTPKGQVIRGFGYQD
ncbi:MAG TPA: amidohydrolase family protein, partial [Chthonomonadaceae bacterium]|nr:amidohydrolase family protein [Chthonomonadaceae bacterium]